MSSPKKLLVGSITGNNNVNVRSFILNSLNHGRGCLIPLADRVSVCVATMTRKIRSLLQPFAQAHPFRKSPWQYGPNAIFSWGGLDSLQVLGFQLARFVEVCAIFVSSVGLEYTLSTIVFKNGQPISASVSISYSTAYLLSQRFEAARRLLCSNRWFGVNGWRSLGSSETAQRGLELRVASTSVRTVASTSSSTRLSPSVAFRAVRVLRISLSHTPLAWEALGGWNTHWHCLYRSSSLIWHWFQFSIACLISRSAPTKLVPLSEYINLGGPLLFTNLLKTLIKQSASSEVASSKCIALEFIHVNIAPHLLTTDLPFLTFRGPK